MSWAKKLTVAVALVACAALGPGQVGCTKTITGEDICVDLGGPCMVWGEKLRCCRGTCLEQSDGEPTCQL